MKRRMKGRGAGLRAIGSFLRKANTFLRKYKPISRVSNFASRMGVPYAGAIGSLSGKAGYGRRRIRSHRGAGLRLAGGGLGLAGGCRYKKPMKRRLRRR